jgi:hypothetical protein
MSINTDQYLVEPAFDPLSLRELTEVLIQHYGVNEGKFDLLFEFQVGIGSIGLAVDSQLPGAMIGISKVGLIKSTADGITTVDAAIVNPTNKARKKPASKIK